MNQSRTRKYLEAKAANILKEDRKFVAKLSGQTVCGRLPRTASKSSRSGSPNSFGQLSETASSAQCSQHAQPARHHASTSDGSFTYHSTQRTTSPVSRVTPDFQPPDIEPPWLAAATALQRASSQADEACTTPSPSAPTVEDDTACYQQQQEAEQQLTAPSGSINHSGYAEQPYSSVQQQVSWLPGDPDQGTTQQEQIEAKHLTAAAEVATGSVVTLLQETHSKPASPSWVLKTAAADLPDDPGKFKIESSLYRSWAYDYDPTQTHVASNVGHRQLTSAAASVNIGSTRSLGQALTIHRETMSQPASNTPPSARPDGLLKGSQQHATATSAAVGSWSADMFATAGKQRASSPTGNRRAAAAVAGLGNTIQDRKYQSWLLSQFPGVKPPKREDAKSLRQWLDQQLQQLQCSDLSDGQLQVPGTTAVGGCTFKVDPTIGTTVVNRRSPNSSKLISSSCPAAAALGVSPDKAATDNSSVDAGWCETGFEAQTSQLLLSAQCPDGSLSVEKLQQQEAVYSAAFHELCRQVSVGCIERGHLMAQLWLSMRAMLLAVLTDRQAARNCEAAAHAATAEAREEADRLQTLQDDERVALRAISERHAAKAEAAKQQMEMYKHKCEQLQDLLQRLSGAQQLVQRVFTLETANTEQSATIKQQEEAIAAQGQRIEELQQQSQAWQSRALSAEGAKQGLAQELRCSTPRPKRDLGMLNDLLTAAEAQLVEQALIAGIPALHVHRLLLGLSPEGEDMRPWADLAGTALQALHAAKDGHHMHQHLQQLLTDCDALGVMKHLQPPESIQLLSQAVHIGAEPAVLMHLLDGSLGLPVFGEAAKKLAELEATTAASAADAKRSTTSIHQPRCPEDSMKAYASANNTNLPGDLTNHRVGNISASGMHPAAHQVQQPTVPAGSSESCKQQQIVATFGIGLPYLPLLGILATKFGHDASDLGGHVTEALVQGQMSTRNRVADLELKTKSMHREILLLKRSLAEQRKHEKERINAALRDQKRKIARREARQPNILEKFLQTKWGDYFMGIGLQEEVPKVLRANVPINNKKMSKREAEKLAKEIWQAKDEHEASTGTRVHLADFTGTFLERRYFAIPRLITEVAYNLIYCLGQHSYDADCNLFLRIFTADVEEAVRYEQQAMEAEIMKLLRLLDISINHQATGWLHKADVKTALAGYFKGKKVDRLAEIFEALDTDDSGDALHYSVMFIDDDDLNQGMTAETIRAQHLQERLEFMQEIDNAIRDAAEDHQTTSLTPFMLQAALSKASSSLPAERAIDEATCDAFIARAFGPDWKDQQYRISQPISTIIRAIRRGSLNTAMRGPAAATAAVAVSKIQPVGRFKGKLMSALKVGMSEAGGSGRTRDRRSSGSAGPLVPESGNLEWRKSLGVSADNTSHTASKKHGHGASSSAQWPRRTSMDVVTAAAAAVLAGGSAPGSKKRSNRITFSEGGIRTAAVMQRPSSAMRSMSRSTTPPLQQQQQQLLPQQQAGIPPAAVVATSSSLALHEASGSEAANPAASQSDSAAPTCSNVKEPSAGDAASVSHDTDGNSNASKGVSVLPSLSLRRTASSVSSGLGSARGSKEVPSSGPPALSSKGGGLGGLRKGAHADTLTVGMLSAMEAVRQSWLKEEEHKLSLSGAPACLTPGSHKPKVNFTGFISLSGGNSLTAAEALSPSLQHTQEQTSVGFSTTDSPGQPCEGSYSHAGSLRIPAVPALQLLNIPEADTDSMPSCSNRSSSTVNSTNRAGGGGSPMSTARRGTDAAAAPLSSSRRDSGSGQRSLPASPRSALKTSASSTGKRVQLMNAEEDGRDLSDFLGGRNSPDAAVGGSSAVNTPRTMLKGSPSSASADKGTRSSSSRRKKAHHPPALLLTDADDVVAATASLMSAHVNSPGAISFSGANACITPGHGCSSPMVPGRLNSAYGVSSPGNAMTSSCGGAGQSSSVIGIFGHDDVCYTPHAPEEGGKMNALLMRKLNKGKSLQRLEEVMLMVASQAGGAAEQEGWG